ncbi:TPA: phage antirepressor protein [Providencia rettgeri]|nr:phage antirepressor protein [Providencia rettgeri]
MNELTLASNETNVTMSSIDFLNNIINPARVMFGENEVKNAHFIKRIEDELDDLPAVKIFNRFGNDVRVYDLNMDQLMLVGMRESKAVRRSVLRELKSLQRKTVSPMAVLNDPEFLRSTLLTYSEKVIALEHTNKELSNKVECMSNLFKEGMTPTQFCKMLNGVNTQQVQMWLAERNWLYNESKSGKNVRWRVASYARDKYMTENQSEINPHGYEPFIKYQPVLLKKGAKRIYDLYLAGELPMKKNWDGLFTHDKELKTAA